MGWPFPPVTTSTPYGSDSSTPAPRSATSNGWAPSGRCSSVTPTAWSSRSAATASDQFGSRRLSAAPEGAGGPELAQALGGVAEELAEDMVGMLAVGRGGA